MALIELNGRTYSVRVPEEEIAVLKKEMAALSSEERETLFLVLQEAQEAEPGRRLIDAMADREWKRTPVDMETFVKDEYYLGATCDGIYPKLLADITELFEGGYHEAIWGGSIGYGKSFISSICMCRVLYELSCMVDPYRSYGLAPNSGIYLVALSITEDLAKKVAFNYIAEKLDNSPYFKENFQYKATKEDLRFANNIAVAARASTNNSVLGLNVLGGILDEGNFFDQNKKVSKQEIGRAEAIYTSLIRRMKSRFINMGKLPGLLCIASSKNTTDDFTQKRLRAAKNDPSIFARDYALWDTRPENYAHAARFFVLCGNEQVSSKIVDDPTELQRLKDNAPDGCVLLEVPEDYRNDFESDLEGAIRDIGGIATVTISPFIQKRDKIYSAVKADTARFGERQHPFSYEVFDPSHGGAFIWDRMVKPTKEPGANGYETKLRPIINPGAIRYVHIDPSYKRDSLGVCVGHIDSWKSVVRRADDGSQYSERSPVYAIDLMLRVKPPIGGEIILSDIRSLIYQLADHGYIIGKITQDTYQSVDGIQQLQQKGFNADFLSVDRTTGPYDILKTALYEDRILYYTYEPLFGELRELQKDYTKRGKIDHPPKGKKDVADALAGVIWGLSQSETRSPFGFIHDTPPTTDPWLGEHRRSAGWSETSTNSSIISPFLSGGEDPDDGGWKPL